ncbi:MAG: outer membrane protein transport protein [Bacteroidetes bacterium]|nr:outer membrane protein transport protein [Bacteroidota bacterium]
MRKVTLLLLCIFITALNSFAGGYQVGLHSTRNIGMGLIGTSLSYDASALFYNPGGAPFIDSKFSISGGATFLMARATYQSQDQVYQEHMNHDMNYPFYFYFAYKPIKDLSIGLAVNTPYGLSMSWPDTWQGRYLIQSVKFSAVTIQPTVSYKFKDIVGIGAGFVISYGNVTLSKAVPISGSGNTDGQANIKGSTVKYGYNIGVMVHPIKKLSLGIDYRSRIDMAVKDAKAEFTVPVSVATKFPNMNVDVTLPLPANLDFGISYEIGEKWMIGLGLNYVFWNVYDSLAFDFKTPTPNTTSVASHQASAKLYTNRLITRLGAQYKINPMFTVRAGGYYDPTPIPSDRLDPMLPGSNEIGLTCGLSIYPTKGLSIDASFEYLMGSERSGISSPDENGSHNFAGTYSTVFYMPGIGLTYNF